MPASKAVTKPSAVDSVDPAQTLRAANALLQKIQSDQAARAASSFKADLLADADDDVNASSQPVWLVLSTKKHIVDKKRLKAGKILLPHALLDPSTSALRICLITADPQRAYKDLVADPSFPLDLSKNISRVIGLSKLKAKYKSYESRRQLYREHDVFFADDRVITYLPQLLGKVFYQTGSKRPVPVSMQGRRQDVDEQGNKRQKLSEGGTKAVRSAAKPAEVASEIQRTLSCALVHLAPSTTTAVKVGHSLMSPQEVQENIEAATKALVEVYVPQKWRNVRSIHIKGPDTAALPIWMAEELWEDEQDVLEEPAAERASKKDKKRKRGVLGASEAEVNEVPGADGKMRLLQKPAVEEKAAKKRNVEGRDEEAAKATEREERAARKAALKKQKVAVRNGVHAVSAVT